MATAPDPIEAALAAHRSARRRLFEASQLRDSLVNRRTLVVQEIEQANADIAAARADVQTTRQAVQDAFSGGAE